MASDEPKIFRIGTRKSALALAQAKQISALLSTAYPHHTFPISTVVVQGDADKTSPFLQMTDKAPGSDAAKRLWTEGMEDELRAGQLDLLVHCLKDMPTALPDGLVLGAVCPREDPTDALVMKAGVPYRFLGELPEGSVVGTSSTRRKALLKRSYPHLVVKECRGNIDTRIRKLDAEDSPFTCIILATAGLVRLNFSRRITERLSAADFPYAVGQGALGIEIRAGDEEVLTLLGAIEDKRSRWRGLAERAMLRRLQGGCSSPVGVKCEFEDGSSSEGGTLVLYGTVVHPQGLKDVRASSSHWVGNDIDAENLGIGVAKKLLESGARELLAQIQAMAKAGGDA